MALATTISMLVGPGAIDDEGRAGAWPGAAHAPAAALQDRAAFEAAARGLPSGIVRLGERLWVSDQAFGFCPLRPVDAQANAGLDRALCSTLAAAPGQPAVDAAHRLVYVPDGALHGVGVVRLRYAQDGTLVGPAVVMTGPNRELAGLGWLAVALSGSGHLYVVSGQAAGVFRIANPAEDPSLPPQTVHVVGTSGARPGPPALSVVDGDLFLAEAAGVSRIANIDACRPSRPCAAVPVAARAPARAIFRHARRPAVRRGRASVRARRTMPGNVTPTSRRSRPRGATDPTAITQGKR